MFPRGREVIFDATTAKLVETLAAASLAVNFRGRYDGQDRERNAYLGAAGEVAVARAMGWPDPAPLRTASDLGRYDVGNVQVRTRAREGWDLMIAPEDRPHANDPFVLVVPWLDSWLVQGWVYGSEAMVPARWTGDPKHPLHGRIPHNCWAVPARELRDLAELELGLV
jgi:hypothetical protein